MTGVFYGLGSRAETEERHQRFQRQSTTHGNWERRIPALPPLWRDLGIGFIAGLIILPPFVLYAAPILIAGAQAVFGAR